MALTIFPDKMTFNPIQLSVRIMRDKRKKPLFGSLFKSTKNLIASIMPINKIQLNIPPPPGEKKNTYRFNHLHEWNYKRKICIIVKNSSICFSLLKIKRGKHIIKTEIYFHMILLYLRIFKGTIFWSSFKLLRIPLGTSNTITGTILMHMWIIGLTSFPILQS